ncbi:helix-turn-helix domain-containing protein [Cupriavidus campinensis]|uniref:DNA-binding protein n=1 Tax=Cupriavidus campinensis TaxID=151783 RepID=UPI0011EE7637|nr:DNA-binding protein [Cupriavidus campinensis]
MIKPSRWHRLPTVPVLEALPQMTWSRASGVPPAAETAALMLFIALNFMVLTSTDGQDQFHAVAEGTYVDLGEATGLSRALISAGLQRLQTLGLITPEGSHQKRRYKITWPIEHRFFKLPCQAITNGNVIVPFKSFTMRSKHELHALKLYLYFASIRGSYLPYSMASYETIFARTRIPERDIRRAISVLIGTGLLEGVDREHSRMRGVNEPNKYYLKGYMALTGQRQAQVNDAATVAGGDVAAA